MAPAKLVRFAAFSFCLVSVRAGDADDEKIATVVEKTVVDVTATACKDLEDATADVSGLSEVEKKCRVHTLWARDTGIDQYPRWYEKYNITPQDNSFADFQCALHLMRGQGTVNGQGHDCPVPCSSTLALCAQNKPAAPKTAAGEVAVSPTKPGSLEPWLIKLILVMVAGIVGAAILWCVHGGRSSKRTVKRKKTRAVKHSPAPARAEPPPPPPVELVAPTSAPLITSAPLVATAGPSYMNAQPTFSTTTYLPAYSQGQGASVAVTGGASMSMAAQGFPSARSTHSSPVPMYARADARSMGGSVQTGVPMTYSPRGQSGGSVQTGVPMNYSPRGQ